MESMREATLRTEEATKNRSSGSMLFGPRGMPQPNASSRSSSRALDDAPPKSEQSTIRSAYSANSSQEAFGRQTSFTSLYSLSDATGTVNSSHKASSARAAHEAAISEVRQMMDGIPSPIEHGARPPHEADYLFDDDDEEEEDAKYAGVETTKFQAMLSPSSEISARFVSYESTVSSVAESTKSKRLPVVPPLSASASMVSDASSSGLTGLNRSSIGDLSQLHRSWYSSSDSLNLAGGGLRSAEIDDDDADVDDSAFASTTAHEMPKSKHAASAGKAGDNGDIHASQQQYSGNYDTRYDIATDFQRMMNVSSADNSNYYGGSGPSVRAASSVMTEMPTESNSSRSVSQMQMQAPTQAHPIAPQSQAQTMPAYYQQPAYSTYQPQPQQMLAGMPSNNGQPPVALAYHTNGGYVAQPGYATSTYSGVDPNGRPYSAYPQQYYAQQAPGVAVGGMTTVAPYSMATVTPYAAPPPEQVQGGYYDPAVYLAQQQQQQPVVP
ncbi:hypothetical protein IWW38_005031, partial [Coemansia aciculifera]